MNTIYLSLMIYAFAAVIGMLVAGVSLLLRNIFSAERKPKEKIENQ